MLEWSHLQKTFGTHRVLDDLCMTVPDGHIFGLVGSNGAGKSTLLRLTAGILRPENGSITVNGIPVYENPEAKAELFYIPDDPYYFLSASPKDMAACYAALYPKFSWDIFRKILNIYHLDENGRIRGFSRGMTRQTFIALAFASGASVILFDETFDGLDPMARQILKKLIAARVAEGTLLPVIASHNLRELADLADRVAILHDGNLLIDVNTEEESKGVFKVQCAFEAAPEPGLFDGLDLIHSEISGRYVRLVVRGNEEEILDTVNALSPLFAETVPMTLEEIFIVQMEEHGYDAQSILQ